MGNPSKPLTAGQCRTPTASLLSVLASQKDGVSAVNPDLENGIDSFPAFEGQQTNKSTEKEANEVAPELVIVEWDGPDDPACPYNWSPLRKWVAMSAVSVPHTSSIHLVTICSIFR